MRKSQDVRKITSNAKSKSLENQGNANERTGAPHPFSLTNDRNDSKTQDVSEKGKETIRNESPFRSRTNETGENRKTCATSRNLETQEELVNAGVVGEFGMERRGENLALAQTDHIAAHRGLNGRGRPDLGHKRSTNEH